ncbi:hypothetical protein PROFUN_13248 [Planoprotostelium fungivorum]|uniref:Uncharacterized protein n=1 Tax=Planoprotostelium fungivorum TaxID=1890364 RepID=A0A2P6N4Y0_9EUKA|nr:hypothetical protein PROFUN_13248 [Planoprotostelium fungivorum]
MGEATVEGTQRKHQVDPRLSLHCNPAKNGHDPPNGPLWRTVIELEENTFRGPNPFFVLSRFCSVTDHATQTLEDRYNGSSGSRGGAAEDSKLFETRNSVTPMSIFRGLFDRSVQQKMLDFMINTFPINENTGKRRKMELLSEDIEKYAAIQLPEMHLAKPDRSLPYMAEHHEFLHQSHHTGRKLNCRQDDAPLARFSSNDRLPHFLHPRDYGTHQAVSGPSNSTKDSSETQKLTEDTPLYTIILHGLHDGQFRVFSKRQNASISIQRRLSANHSNGYFLVVAERAKQRLRRGSTTHIIASNLTETGVTTIAYHRIENILTRRILRLSSLKKSEPTERTDGMILVSPKTLIEEPMNTTIHNNLYGYEPSVPLATIAVISYALAVTIGTILTIYYRQWNMLVLTGSGIADVLGYALRISSAQKPGQLTLYIGTTLFILLPPTVAATISYGTLAKMMERSGSKTKLFTPKITKWGFLVTDVSAFFLQASGGGLMARSGTANAGRFIIVFGLFVSLACFIFFEGLTIWANIKARKMLDFGEEAPKWHHLFIALHLSMLMLIIRSVYRVAEFAPGYHSALALNEGAFYALDGVPVLLLYVLWIPLHPGIMMRGFKDTEDMMRKPLHNN